MKCLVSIGIAIPAMLLVTGCPAVITLGTRPGTGLQHGTGPAPGGRTHTYDKLPDTLAGHAVHAFSDQPSQANPLDKTVQFAATHFAGAQKMTAEEKARFVAVNPNWVQLHNRLGVASGPAQYIHLDQWESDWTEVDSHNDWFLLDSNNNRSEATAANGGWDLHDLSSTDFHQYWLDNVSQDLQADSSDAVLADYFLAGVGCAYLDPTKCDSRLQGTGAGDVTRWPSGITWLSRLNDWVDEIQSTLHALPGEPLLLPNLDALNAFWAVSMLRLSTFDGAFLENFPIANQNSGYSSANTNALTLTASDRFVIMQSTVTPTSLNQRSFVVGTYLLLKGKRTFLNMTGGTGDTGFYYWPEYDVDLGQPVGQLPTDFSTLRWGTVYRRNFEKGMVLVNGSAAVTSVSLPTTQTWYQVIPSGGGAVSEAQIDAEGGVSGMSLTYQSVSGTLSVPAWSGMILVNSHP